MSKKQDPSYYAGPQAGDFARADEPFTLFQEWMAEAEQHEPNDPNAMGLATVDADGLPNLRMVLLKEAGPQGFVFYTNRESAKGRELEANAKAALCFHWKSLRRQVRVRGPIEQVEDSEADAYFATRPRGSRIGAWASQQSWALVALVPQTLRVTEHLVEQLQTALGITQLEQDPAVQRPMRQPQNVPVLPRDPLHRLQMLPSPLIVSGVKPGVRCRFERRERPRLICEETLRQRQRFACPTLR